MEKFDPVLAFHYVVIPNVNNFKGKMVYFGSEVSVHGLLLLLLLNLWGRRASLVGAFNKANVLTFWALGNERNRKGLWSQ